VILIRVMGVILVIALLTIPSATAAQYTYNLKELMLLSVIFSIVFTTCYLWLSYTLKSHRNSLISITEQSDYIGLI